MQLAIIFKTVAHAANCSVNAIEGIPNFLAASSEERGYLNREQILLFDTRLEEMIQKRARSICALKNCGKLIEYNTYESTVTTPIITVIGDKGPIVEEELELKRPWRFGNTGYQNQADCIWYTGHILSIGTLLSVQTRELAYPFVIGGQLLTMLSRPLGRLPISEITGLEGIKRLNKRQPVSRIHVKTGLKISHLLFQSVRCETNDLDVVIDIAPEL